MMELWLIITTLKKLYQDTKKNLLYIFYRVGLRRISIGGGAVRSLTRRDGPGFGSQDDDDEAWGSVCLFGRLLLRACDRGSG